MKQFALVLAFIFVGGLMVGPLQAQDEPQHPNYELSVWYPSSEDPTGYDSVLDNLDVITEINAFWYSASPDGNILTHDNAEDAEKIAVWREAGVLVVPSIASFGVSTMIETEVARNQHIQIIVDRVVSMDYDGIDIDYEGFALSTKDAFSIFVEDLTTALHQHNKLMSVTVHAKTDAVSPWDAATAQDWPRLAAAVDIFRIMTYDYHNRASDAGPIAPLHWVEDVLAYASSVTDLQKVRLGIHFYGYAWRRPVAVVTWTAVQQWQSSFGLPIIRDPADMEARLEVNVRGLPNQTVYVADSLNLAYKVGSVLRQYPELGGFAVWGIGGEDPANWDVFRSIQGNPQE